MNYEVKKEKKKIKYEFDDGNEKIENEIDKKTDKKLIK